MECGMNGEQLVIYTSEDGSVQTEVRLEHDTVWLTQKQMADLFQTSKQNISLHIKNCFLEGELSKNGTVKEYLTVQTEGKRKIERMVEYYNLDVIISVGYRVKSLRGTQFRIWANRILKEHLIQGYTINEKRLIAQRHKLQSLKETIVLVERSLEKEGQTAVEAKNLVSLLAEFAKGLDLLDDYDHNNLETKGKNTNSAIRITTKEFLSVVDALRKEYDSDLFGKQKDDSFDSSVNQIYQTFNGEDVYPTTECKAANLLYLVTKNHSFVDGNKRIAAAVFIYFLEKNKMLYKKNGEKIIDNDSLAAITLLIAVSKPEEKETMIKIVMTILNRNQD
jgi:prophage maintenance system killer protein